LDSRTRFAKAFEFERADRLPFTEFLGYWGETLRQWTRQGMPERAFRIGLDEFFGFDKKETFPLDLGPIPRFVTRTKSEDSRYKLWRDGNGIVSRMLKTGESMPDFIEHPVKNEEDFDGIKRRYDPSSQSRLPKEWGDEELFDYYSSRDFLLHLSVPGFFGQPRQWLGMKKTLIAFVTQEAFIKEMIDFWTDFVINATGKVLDEITPDYITIWEDMSYKNGPLISPRSFEKQMLPAYQKVTEFFRSKGVKSVFVDSDGDVSLLLPLWVRGGVNGMYPLEVASNVHAEEVNEKYGKKLVLIGNVDKRKLAQGRKAIDEELRRLKGLLDNNMLIPSVDHAVPPDVPYEDYLYYLDRLKPMLS
jgi:uroporphyrinogen decarboxylase